MPSDSMPGAFSFWRSQRNLNTRVHRGASGWAAVWRNGLPLRRQYAVGFRSATAVRALVPSGARGFAVAYADAGPGRLRQRWLNWESNSHRAVGCGFESRTLTSG